MNPSASSKHEWTSPTVVPRQRVQLTGEAARVRRAFEETLEIPLPRDSVELVLFSRSRQGGSAQDLLGEGRSKLAPRGTDGATARRQGDGARSARRTGAQS